MVDQPETVKNRFENKNVPCVDCPDKKEFIWEAGEQEFYERNQLHPPIRCPYHRRLKAQKRREMAQKGSYDRNAKQQ